MGQLFLKTYASFPTYLDLPFPFHILCSCKINVFVDNSPFHSFLARYILSTNSQSQYACLQYLLNIKTYF